MNNLKANAANTALEYLNDHTLIGVGTGSTVDYFIQALATIKHRIDGCIPSSKATEARLRELGLPIVELNAVDHVPIYVDGADEVNPHGEMIKGGGGALTREKIIASAARQFVCIVDETKSVRRFHQYPVAVEVIPMARSFVARKLVMLGGNPSYRQGFITDNGNIILDVFDLKIDVPSVMEHTLKLIPGVVESGIFAERTADRIIIASSSGVKTLQIK